MKNDKIYELLKILWDKHYIFETLYDTNDNLFIYFIFRNGEFSIYNDSDAEKVLEVLKYFG